MSRVEVTKCDACKNVADGCHSFNILYDSRVSGAGDREYLYHTIDLCHNCCTRMLEDIFVNRDADEGVRLLDYLGVKIRR